jgi:hypothetical protein
VHADLPRSRLVGKNTMSRSHLSISRSRSKTSSNPALAICSSLVPPPTTTAAAAERVQDKSVEVTDWYFATRKL